jgi:hypothetical protein
LRYSSRQFLSLRYEWGRCGSPHHQGAGPQIISMCLIMRCTPDSVLVDRVELSLSSRSVTSLSALARRSGLERSDFVLWPVSTVRGSAAIRPELGVKPTCRGRR